MADSALLKRAYAVLDIKGIDSELRVIRGTASTPRPDREGDIIEPSGARFAPSIPLLLFHNSRQPVGTAKLAKGTDAIGFEATFPEIPEPASLKDRIEEAWASVNSKPPLIRGVSIGFRALENGMEALKGGGIRFTKIEILELSLVAIPANADATIDTIKSFDAPYLALSGTQEQPSRPPNKPAAVGAVRVHVTQKDRSMTPVSEQIKTFEATRQAKAARQDEIMDAAATAGLTLDDAQKEEYDTLEGEIKGIDEHLVRLNSQLQRQKQAAQPVAGNEPAQGLQARTGGAISVKQPDLPPGIGFTRVVICKAASFVGMMRGEWISPLEVAKKYYPGDEQVQQYLKSPVAAGTTTDSTWAGPLVNPTTLTNEFVEFLRPQTIIGKFGTNGIPSLRRVPFNVRIAGQTSGGSAYWVGQGKPKPLTKFDFEANTLTWAKIAAVSVIAEELARFSSPSAEALVRDSLASAIVAKLDSDFITPSVAAVSNVSPAAITYGLTPLSSAGTSEANIRTDVQNLLEQFILNNVDPTSLVLIMPATLALALSVMVNSLGQPSFPGLTMRGGSLLGIPVITSQHAANAGSYGNLVVAVNASDIYLSDDGQVNVDVSREASLEMSDAPTQNGAAGTGASMVSLWQNNLIGLRAERYINWSRRRDESVVVMDDVNWGAIGSPV